MGAPPSHLRHNKTTRRGKKQAHGQAHTPGTTARGGTTGRWGAIPYILTVWCVSRIILTGVGVLARSWLGQVDQVSNVQRYFGIGIGYDWLSWLNIWSAWDARWYYIIADVGYLNAPTHHISQHVIHSAWAFFPLYPWLTQALAVVVGNTYAAFLIVSNVSLLIGAWLLYQLVEQHWNSDRARKTVLFLFLFPTAYIFSCLMTESLFLALSVGAWYYGTRGNWLMAGVLGMGSVMTRTVGLFMAPLLALEYLRQRQWNFVRVRPDVLWIGLVPVGLGVFMAFCYIATGNPLKFREAQNLWEGAVSSDASPLYSLYWSLNKAWQGKFAVGDGSLGLGYGAIVTIVGTGVLLWGRKQIGNLLFVWSIVLILLPLWSHLRTYSLPRYLVVLFPLFIILASLRTKSAAFVITVAVLALLQAATFALWTTGRIFAL